MTSVRAWSLHGATGPPELVVPSKPDQGGPRGCPRRLTIRLHLPKTRVLGRSAGSRGPGRVQSCRGEDGFELDGLAYRLALSTDDAQEVLSQLVAGGYVEPHKDRWGTTIAGNALCLAKASKPVKRTTAQRQLDSFLERAPK
jgi:hypothetical protein